MLYPALAEAGSQGMLSKPSSLNSPATRSHKLPLKWRGVILERGIGEAFMDKYYLGIIQQKHCFLLLCVRF